MLYGMKNPSYPRAHYNRFSGAFEIVFPDGSNVCHSMGSPVLEAGVYLAVISAGEVNVSWVEEDQYPDADGFGGQKSVKGFTALSCTIKNDGAYGEEVGGRRESSRTAFMETAVSWAKSGSFEVASIRP